MKVVRGANENWIERKDSGWDFLYSIRQRGTTLREGSKDCLNITNQGNLITQISTSINRSNEIIYQQNVLYYVSALGQLLEL